MNRRRLAIALAGGALVAAMLPGMASAAPAPWAGDHPPDPCDDLRGYIGPEDERVRFEIFTRLTLQFECPIG